jgi:hypothetical protein
LVGGSLGFGVLGSLGFRVFGLWVIVLRFEDLSLGTRRFVMACRCHRFVILEFGTFKVCVVGVRFWGFVFSVR